MNPTVSIVIPCYNDKDFILEAVESAINQTIDKKEIIIVDDGSNNETKKVLDGLKNKVDRIITQKNEGVSAARNVGIRNCNGEYVLVLDSDDFFAPTFCEKAVSVFLKASKVKIVTCYANWFHSKKVFQIYKPKGGEVKNFLLNSAAIGNSMFRKRDWYLIGGYDEKMIKGWEDWEFFIRLLKDGGEAYVIPEVLFYYRNRQFSRNKLANKHKKELFLYIVLKHENLFKSHYMVFVSGILKKLEKTEREKVRVKKSLEYRIGSIICWPFKKIKYLLNEGFVSK